MRNIATRHDEPRQSPPPRRASVPAVAFSPVNTTPSTPGGDEEEEAAVAGRLEIRVVDATGGATVVQTTADREPLQSKCKQPDTARLPVHPTPSDLIIFFAFFALFAFFAFFTFYLFYPLSICIECSPCLASLPVSPLFAENFIMITRKTNVI